MSKALLKPVLVLGSLGGILLLCMLQSEYLWLPSALEPLGRALYRVAFFVVLPFRGIVALLIPRVDHHWPLAHFVVTCLGTPFFLYALVGLGRWVVRRWRSGHPHPHSPCQPVLGRRQFLFRSAAGAAGLASTGMGGYASLVAPARLKVREYEIPIRDLPSAFEGLRIVHLSDTHYGPFVSRPYLEGVIRQANDLVPDIVALTGDYVHFTPRSVEPGIELFSELRARRGIFAVLGNHEHWEGADACRAVFRRIGVPLLDNGRVFLTPGGPSASPVDGDSLCLAGVGDLWEDEVLFGHALAGVDEATPRIVLSHNPEAAECLEGRQRADLMLSGHTHGGQVLIPGIGPPVRHGGLMEKYMGGLCYADSMPVVVSRGVGVAGIPVRFCVPPEIGVVTLSKT